MKWTRCKMRMMSWYHGKSVAACLVALLLCDISCVRVWKQYIFMFCHSLVPKPGTRLILPVHSCIWMTHTHTHILQKQISKLFYYSWDIPKIVPSEVYSCTSSHWILSQHWKVVTMQFVIRGEGLGDTLTNLSTCTLLLVELCYHKYGILP